MGTPAGWKNFTSAMLSSTEVNDYLMSQTVMVFASATARTSGLGTPNEGNLTYLKDSNSFWYYDGSSWINMGNVMVFASYAARLNAIPVPVEGMLTWLGDVDELQVYNGVDWLTLVVTNDDQQIVTTGYITADQFYSYGSSNLYGEFVSSNATGAFFRLGRGNSSSVTEQIVMGSAAQLVSGGSLANSAIMGRNGTLTLGTGASAGVVIDSSQYVRHPTQPRFLATRSGDLTSYNPSSQVNPIVFNATTYNVGSHYNTSTGLFQAPVTGTYWFQVGSYQSVAVSQLWWVINGARERSFVLENYGLGNLSGAGLLYLNATDTVGVVSWSGGSTCTIYSNFFHTYFRGGLVI